jgi:tetratricopeptide (TPR) repeat protein
MAKVIFKIVTVLLVPVAIIILGFWLNPLLGILAILLVLAFAFYTSRVDLYAMRGNIRYAKGDMDGAVKWLRRAYEMKDNKPQHQIAYGYLLLKTGDIQGAEEVFSNVNENHLNRESKLKLQLNKAFVLWKKGMKEEAIERTAGLHEEYKNSMLYGTLGYFYILTGNLEQALSFNLEAYEYSGTDKVILDNLGQTYYMLGEYDKALEIYEKLLPLDPKFPEAHYNYGLVLEHKGEHQAALDSMHNALKYKDSLISSITKENIHDKIDELRAKL